MNVLFQSKSITIAFSDCVWLSLCYFLETITEYYILFYIMRHFLLRSFYQGQNMLWNGEREVIKEEGGGCRRAGIKWITLWVGVCALHISHILPGGRLFLSSPNDKVASYIHPFWILKNAPLVLLIILSFSVKFCADSNCWRKLYL